MQIKVYRFISNLPAFRNPVLTIGTFDGVHKGHQKIIQRINEIARQHNGESVVLTFHPHPRTVLHPEDPSLKLINTLEERIELLDQYGINYLLLSTFSREFSQLTPEEYIADCLIRKIHPKTIVIGYDHRFGKDRAGDIRLMKKYAGTYGYRVEEIPAQVVDDMRVSSTKIRKAILAGEISRANDLLGHYFTLRGKVIEGNKVGKELGFPTANLFVEDKNKIIPGIGIYAVYVRYAGKRYKGMLYIGYRPTFSGTEKTIEVNIFNLDGRLYGQELIIDFVAKTRDDKRFSSREELAEQLARDKEDALRVLGTTDK